MWWESDRDEWSCDLISLYVFFTFDVEALRMKKVVKEMVNENIAKKKDEKER